MLQGWVGVMLQGVCDVTGCVCVMLQGVCVCVWGGDVTGGVCV